VSVSFPNPWRDLRGLPREIWLLFITTLINRAGTMALPFLVLYLTRGLHLSAGHAGFALTVYGIGALLGNPLAGRLSDRVGPLRVMRISLLLSGALLLLFPLLRSYPAILTATFAWAVIGEAFRPASLAVVGDLVAPEQRRAAFAVSRLAINLGMSVGPAVGGFLATVSFSALFLIDGATSLAAGVVLALSPWRTAGEAHPFAEHGSAAPIGVLADRRALLFLFAVFLVGVVFLQHEAAMPLFLVRDLGYPESFYGLLFTVNTLLIIFLEVPLNSAMAGWPHRKALVLGALLVAAGFGLLGVAGSPWAITATVVVWTFGEMILFPTSAAYVTDLAPAARRGEYMGAYSMAFSMAFILGPWAGTALLDRMGGAVLWTAIFACGALAAGVMGRVEAPAAEAARPALS
jgi:MFS family permease